MGIGDRPPANKFLSSGRTWSEEAQDVCRQGSHGTPAALRNMLLRGLGLPPSDMRAENLVLFGCYMPFSAPFLLRSYVRLLDRLEVDYTYLSKESCCGTPLLISAEEDNREEAKNLSRELLNQNLAAAEEIGARTVAYFCKGCWYVSQKYLTGPKINETYYADIFMDKLSGKSLRVKPTVVGYFEGCHTHYRQITRGVELDWGKYRKLLDRIEGLKVVDLPNKICCHANPQGILAEAAGRNLDTIVSTCISCAGNLGKAAGGKVKVLGLPDLLLDALG